MESLSTVNLAGKTVRRVSLGINRLHYSHLLPGEVVLSGVVRELGLPPDTSPHSLLAEAQLVNVRLCTARNTKQCVNKLPKHYKAQGNVYSNQYIQDLLSTVDKSGAEHRSHVEPILSSCDE